VPTGARVIDGTGKYLIPGLIDAHIHLGTLTHRTPEITQALLRNAFMGGVTTGRDMGSRMGIVRPLAARAALDTTPWPRVYYSAVMAGPGSWFEGERGPQMAEGGPIGASPLVRLIDDTTDLRAAVTAAKQAGATGVKLYNTIPLPILRPLVAEAKRQGLKVWAHLAVDPVTPTQLIEAGVEVVSHADQLAAEVVPYPPPGTPVEVRRAMRGETFRTATPETPAFAQLFRTMRERGTILDATLYIMTPRPDSAGRVPESPLYQFATRMVRGAYRAGVPIVAGTDDMARNAPNIHVELQLLTDTVGMSTADALRAATSVAARAIGASDSLGTVQPGKLADLVLLRADPLADIANTQAIIGVMKGGHWVVRETPMRAIPLARPPRTP
jgi:hypothetical protein